MGRIGKGVSLLFRIPAEGLQDLAEERWLGLCHLQGSSSAVAAAVSGSRDRERGPLAVSTLDLDGTAVGFDDPAANARDRALAAPRSGRHPLIESLEDVGQVVGEMPWPISCTRSKARSPRASTRSVTVPAGFVNRMALSRRFVTSCRRRDRSPRTGTGAGALISVTS